MLRPAGTLLLKIGLMLVGDFVGRFPLLYADGDQQRACDGENQRSRILGEIPAGLQRGGDKSKDASSKASALNTLRTNGG